MQELSDRIAIINHLREVAELRIPLRASRDKDYRYSYAHLLFLNGAEPKLVLKLATDQPIQDDVLELDYAMFGKAFAFQGHIVSRHPVKADMSIVQLAWPDKIQYAERRLYLRAKLTPHNTLAFDLMLPDKPSMRLLAENVSGGGIGFFAPRGAADFSPGQMFNINLYIDELSVQTRMVVRSAMCVFDMARVGSEFIDLNARQRMVLVEYAVTAQASGLTAQTDCPAAINNAILVATDRRSRWPVGDLEKEFSVKQASIADALFQVDTQLPELIILDLDSIGAVDLLKEIKITKGLNTLPLVLASSKGGHCMQNRLDIRFIQLPVQTMSLRTLIEGMIHDHRNALLWQAQLVRNVH